MAVREILQIHMTSGKYLTTWFTPAVHETSALKNTHHSESQPTRPHSPANCTL